MEHADLKAIPQGMHLLLPLATIFSQLVPMLVADAISNMPPPTSAPRSGCPSMCGNVSIPYPFGIGNDCAWPGGDNFTVTCNHRYSPPRPYYSVSDKEFEIISISVETSEMRIFSSFASICFTSSTTYNRLVGWSLNYTDSPFLISPTCNQFTAIGGNTLAFMEGREDFTYYTGCITSSITLDGAARDGDECTGLGCCQTMVAGNLSYVHMYWTNNLVKHPINNAWNYSPCGYAFLAEKGWYKFSRRDLLRNGSDTFSTRVRRRSIPVVLDWAIRNGSCQTTSACVSSHSHCVNAAQGPGYLCKCFKGYTGNPYIRDPDGCTNINECASEISPCGKDSTCKDTDGGFNCPCNFNRKGDGKSVRGCDDYVFPPYAIAAVATFVAVVLGCIAIILLQSRNDRKIFIKNGGKILETQGITIYTKRELKKITNEYSKLLGGGYFGKVYEGKVDRPEARKVAVKRPVATRVAHPWNILIRPHVPQQAVALDENGSFINEIKIQFDVRHKNMVRLLGCCLETDIPRLVFEFISNGSLDDALHSVTKPCTLSLLERLDIAIGSAEAIAYMHSLDNQKHVHGDIKPSNILLDDDLNPKVSDFGSTKILSVDSYYVRSVAGDWDYMDPLYIRTGHFTLECDVYSFGVVLLELITRKRAKYGDGGKNLLSVEFVGCFNDEDSRRAMYDEKIYSSGEDAQSQRNTQCLDRIGMLAVRCLKEDKRERPTMAEVVEELMQAKAIACSQAS